VFYAVAFYFVPLLLDVAPGVLLRRLRVLVVPGVGVGTAGVVGRLATEVFAALTKPCRAAARSTTSPVDLFGCSGAPASLDAGP